jgi:hypothetical protein
MGAPCARGFYWGRGRARRRAGSAGSGRGWRGSFGGGAALRGGGGARARARPLNGGRPAAGRGACGGGGCRRRPPRPAARGRRRRGWVPTALGLHGGAAPLARHTAVAAAVRGRKGGCGRSGAARRALAALGTGRPGAGPGRRPGGCSTAAARRAAGAAPRHMGPARGGGARARSAWQRMHTQGAASTHVQGGWRQDCGMLRDRGIFGGGWGGRWCRRGHPQKPGTRA